MTSPVVWYVDRATGVVALVLMTATVVLGVMVQRQRRLPGLPRFGTLALHRNVSLVSATFLVLHVLLAVIDSYVSIGWLAVVVPFTSAWRPLPVALGTLAIDLLVLVLLTSLIRGRIPVRLWRWVHWTSYLLWPLAFLHGLTAGTDVHSRVLLLVVGGCAVVFAASTAVAWTGRRTRVAGRAPAAVAAATGALRRGARIDVFRNR